MKNTRAKLLVALVAVMMLIALVPVAMASEVTASTLADLQTHLGNSAVRQITLTSPLSISSNVELSSDHAVTIIADNQVDAFTVTGGTLKIKGQITIESNTSILWANGGTITIDGAVLNANSSYTAGGYPPAFAENGGTINVVSGSINNEGEHNTLSVKGTGKANISGGSVTGVSSEYTVAVAKEGGDITISQNGKVEGKITAITATGSGSTITVEGGLVQTTAAPNEGGNLWWAAGHAVNHGQIVVTGGTVKSENGRAIVTEANGTAEIKGGAITGGDMAVYAWPTSGALVVSGGVFSDKTFVPYLAEGLTDMEYMNGYYTVGRPAASHSAPKTGDSTPIAMLTMLLVASALGMTIIRRKAYR